MINYLKKVEGVSTPLATRFEPLYKVGERERSYAGENPDVYVDGVWHNSTNGDDKLVGTDFSDGSVGNWLGTTNIVGLSNSTISVQSGQLKILNPSAVYGASHQSFVTVIGRKYKLKFYITNGNALTAWILKVGTSISDDGSIVSYSSATFGQYEVEFVATSSLTFVTIANSNQSGGYALVDNISVFETEIEPDTPYTTPQTYLPIKADINAEGEITSLIAWDTPSLVEDYIVADKVKAELLGKNACTAWVNFDGSGVVPIINDEYHVDKVLKVGTGKYKIIHNLGNKKYNVVFSGIFGSGNGWTPFYLNKNDNDVEVHFINTGGVFVDCSDVSVEFKGGKN